MSEGLVRKFKFCRTLSLAVAERRRRVWRYCRCVEHTVQLSAF
jgi:hypothetical protein